MSQRATKLAKRVKQRGGDVVAAMELVCRLCGTDDYYLDAVRKVYGVQS